MKWFALGLGVIVLLVAAVIGWVKIEPTVGRWVMLHRGHRIVAHIEAYRNAHGAIPDRLSQIDIRVNEDAWFYEHHDQQYDLGFFTWFDEGYAYESKTKQWKRFANPP